MEVWKWVKGYEGLYEISNYGNFRSYANKEKKGRQIKLTDKTGWYLSYTLRREGESPKTKRIHVLVAEAFIGEIPKGYHVHHKDGNKQNNHVDNLEILHPSDHVRETIELNPNFLKGMNNYNRFVKPQRIAMLSDDGHYLATFANSEIASQMTGVCQRNILQVARREPYGKNHKVRKQAGGYVWRFESEVMKDGYVENNSNGE